MKIERSVEYPDFIYDRLYGRIEFTSEDLKLFQTRELARVRQVSLSAVPTWTLPTGLCASKFEHSVGVGHLARIVGERPEFQAISKDLYFAALAHDMGTPPFSHVSERFLLKFTGKDHEEFLEDIIRDSEFAEEVKRQGGSIDRVIRFVQGRERPWSDLVNGTIDIDNLDNTLRFGISMGLFQEPLYSPERLAKAFVMQGENLSVLLEDQRDLERWEKCRKVIYEIVYSPAILSPASMLFRAIDFATREGEIGLEYFLMTDAQAFFYLREKCNQRTRKLAERLERWIFYARIFNFVDTISTNDNFSVKGTSKDFDARSTLADELSEFLKVSPEDVAIFIGRDRGFKKIHLPILDANGDVVDYVPTNTPVWMAQVYVHPKHLERTIEIHEFMKDKLFLNVGYELSHL